MQQRRVVVICSGGLMTAVLLAVTIRYVFTDIPALALLAGAAAGVVGFATFLLTPPIPDRFPEAATESTGRHATGQHNRSGIKLPGDQSK